MAVIKLKNGKCIGEGIRPYIIAEMNSSHNGNLETAMKMVDAAKECGCDCVKFQSWSADTLYSKQYYKQNPISERIVKKFSLDEEKLAKLVKYCEEKEIDFSSTPYSNEEVDFLVDVAKVPFIKIASMEINNIGFLQYIAKKNLPIILSTGMATSEEIAKAVKTIVEAGNTQLCILHCVSVYPASPEIINLNNMKMLQKMFPEYTIGYSDHTLGYEVASASVALGASVVEKHFTLDHSKMGMDNGMATEPEEMKRLVEACHNVFNAMGAVERVVYDYEIDMQLKMRRSIVAKKDILPGTVLTEDLVEAKRPGDGIAPDKLGYYIGKRINEFVPMGYQIKENMF